MPAIVSTPIWRIDPFSVSSGARDAARKADKDKNGVLTNAELDAYVAENEAIVASGNPANIHDYDTPEGRAKYNLGEVGALRSVLSKGTPSAAHAALGVVIRKPADMLSDLFSVIFKNVI